VRKFFKTIKATTLHDVVAIAATHDETGAPTIQLYFQPEGLDVCSIVLSYSDTDKGGAARDRFLESLNPESVTKIIAPALALASGVIGGES